MSKEQFGHIENQNKREQITEEEKKETILKAMEYQKSKEKLLTRLEKEKSLSFLRSFVERGLIETSTVEQMLSNSNLDSTAISEIFTMIDEIESTHNVDAIFPKIYRVSREEYLQALENPVSRLQTLTKIDTSLVFIYNSINPHVGMGVLSFFSGFMNILDKNLIKIQEHTIDIKRSLQ
jgi:transcription initiation factor TFIIIB Brf1 subunit/transcription initiation factor TFIIB